MALHVVLGIQWVTVTVFVGGEGGGGGEEGEHFKKEGSCPLPAGCRSRRVRKRAHTAGGSFKNPLEAVWAEAPLVLAALVFPDHELPLSVSLELRDFPLSLDLLPRRRGIGPAF